MREITIGKYRGMQRCSTPGGAIICLALDHRQNLRRAMNPKNPDAVSDEALTEFKLEVLTALSDLPTAVLLDPQYSAAQAVTSGALPGRVGLVVALEATGYVGKKDDRLNQLLPGWSVAKAKRMGADMVKLLVYYHPKASSAPQIRSLVSQVAEECQYYDIALMLEPLSYSLDEQRSTLSSQEKREVVLQTAIDLTPLGVDLLKAEFPVNIREDEQEAHWAEACQELTRASQAPWILLSAAVDFATYHHQVAVALKHGACGIAAGRAVWSEAVHLPHQERALFLQNTARLRFQQLAETCLQRAKPWFSTLKVDRENFPPQWYLDYEAPLAKQPFRNLRERRGKQASRNVKR